MRSARRSARCRSGGGDRREQHIGLARGATPLPEALAQKQIAAQSRAQALARKQVAAKSRTGELQDIFVSRHSAECDRLQSQLALLDGEEANLRSTLGTLQSALEEAIAERKAGERSVVPGSGAEAAQAEPGPHAAQAVEVDELPPHPTTARGSRRESLDGDVVKATFSLPIPEKHHAKAAEDAAAAGAIQKLNLQDYTKELTSPIISKRRAEAKFREACLVHESNMNRMKAEYAELERRLRKQQTWMQSVDTDILQAELSKVRYSIRLDKAERRVKSLSTDLSRAYDNIVGLLDERLRLEDTKARNEALTAYLDVLGKAELKNADHFAENKGQLSTLLERCRQCSASQTELDALVDDAQYKQVIVKDIRQKCGQVLFLNRDFNYQWSQIPAAWKETVFRFPENRQEDKLVHPVSAMQTVHDAMTDLGQSFTRYLTELANVTRSPSAHFGPADGEPNPGHIDFNSPL